MRRFAHRRVALLVIGAIAALAIAACGSSSNSNSSSSAGSSTASGATSTSAGATSTSAGATSTSAATSSSGGSSGGSSTPIGVGPGSVSYLDPVGQRGLMPSTGAYAAKAIAAGKVAAAKVGGKTKLPADKTLGIINFLNGIQSSDRLSDTTTYAAHQLGWKTIVCDGKGTPSQFVACGQSLLAQHVNGIIAIAEEPGQLTSVIAKAKSAGVPVTQCGGGAEPLGGFNGNYGPDEQKAGQLLSTYVLGQLDKQPGNPSVVIHNFPAEWGADRTLQFTNALKKQSKVKVAADITTDASNIVPFTRNAVSDEITQDPTAGAYWFTFDTTGQVGGTVLAAKYKGKSFPNAPLVVTFHGDPATLTLMRQGVISAVSDTNYDAGCWEAVDQTAEFIARHRAESTANQPTYPVIGDPFTYEIITKANVPPAGQYLHTKWDVPSYFISKWQNEFGVAGAK
jgi:ABC-type sugar transport system substrate-binding protein